jgi:hypothetical protein
MNDPRAAACGEQLQEQNMAKYMLLAMNGPTAGEGDEAAYNKWYDEVHVPDLLTVPNLLSAQRYKVVQSNTPYPYVAAYEIETDDLAQTLKDMSALPNPFPAYFDSAKSGHILAIALDSK